MGIRNKQALMPDEKLTTEELISIIMNSMPSASATDVETNLDTDETLLNHIYLLIHDLYHFGLCANHPSDASKIWNRFFVWMYKNMDIADIKTIIEYLYYSNFYISTTLFKKHKPSCIIVSPEFHPNDVCHYMIIPLKCINNEVTVDGLPPLESYINSYMFVKGGTQKLMSAYKNLCRAYHRCEESFENKSGLINNSNRISDYEKIKVKHITQLNRMLFWWDLHGRITGRTSDLNYIDISQISSLDACFSSTTKFLTAPAVDVDKKLKEKMFKMLKISKWYFNIDSWDTKNITSLNATFRYCETIPSCISKWNVENIVSMYWTFKGAKNIPDISNWNVSNVETMYETFYGASNIPDISKWNVAKVTSMKGIFQKTKSQPDISKWKTPNLLTLDLAFSDAVLTADLSDWDVSSVSSFFMTFNNCTFKTDTDFTNWNVSNAQDMGYMFKNSHGHLWIKKHESGGGGRLCKILRNTKSIVLDIAAWNLENAYSIIGIFEDSDFSADISNWKLEKVARKNNMVRNCKNDYKLPENCITTETPSIMPDKYI